MKKRISTLFLSITPVFVYLAVMVVVQAIGGTVSDTLPDNEIFLAASELIAGVLGSLYTFALVKERTKATFREAVHIKNFDISVPIMTAVLNWSAVELIKTLDGLILSNFMTVEPNTVSGITLSYVLSMLVFAPIFEEITVQVGHPDSQSHPGLLVRSRNILPAPSRGNFGQLRINSTEQGTAGVTLAAGTPGQRAVLYPPEPGVH